MDKNIKINKNMNNKFNNNQNKQPVPTKPNENAGFYFSSNIKIFDPNTNEILVKKRGDL